MLSSRFPGAFVVLALAELLHGCDNEGHCFAPDAGDAALDAQDTEDGGVSRGCDTPLAFDVLQLGTAAADEAASVAIDADCNLYVAGATSGQMAHGEGSLPGAGKDVFLRRISRDGASDFTVQQGSDADEDVAALALAPSGDAVVAGTTYGQLPGAPYFYGGVDTFALAFTETGTRRFVSQYGSIDNDFGTAVTVRPDGNILVGGATLENVVVGLELSVDTLHGATGAVLERARYGSDLTDRAEGITLAADGTVHVVGSTLGRVAAEPLGSFDVLVVSRGPAITHGPRFLQRSTRDIDAAIDVAVDDAGNLYVAAISYSDLDTGAYENDGIRNAFLIKISPEGEVRFVRRLGAVTENSGIEAVVIGSDGYVYVAGRTEGDLFGENAGGMDAFVARFDADGALMGGRQIGTAEEDVAVDLVVTRAGEAVIVGRTGGALAGEGSALGEMDAFVARFATASFQPIP